jgi:hypothetical protein
LPVDLQIAGVLRVERALAVAQTTDEGAACLLSQNIAVGLAPLAEGALDDTGEAAGDSAEEAVAGVEDLVGAVSAGAWPLLLGK